MLNLSHVLEFIVDTLDNRPLPDKDFVSDSHQCPFHVAPEFRKELYTIYKQFFEQPIAYVPLYKNFRYFLIINVLITNIYSSNSRYLHQTEAYTSPFLSAHPCRAGILLTATVVEAYFCPVVK